MNYDNGHKIRQIALHCVAYSLRQASMLGMLTIDWFHVSILFFADLFFAWRNIKDFDRSFIHFLSGTAQQRTLAFFQNNLTSIRNHCVTHTPNATLENFTIPRLRINDDFDSSVWTRIFTVGMLAFLFDLLLLKFKYLPLVLTRDNWKKYVAGQVCTVIITMGFSYYAADAVLTPHIMNIQQLMHTQITTLLEKQCTNAASILATLPVSATFSLPAVSIREQTPMILIIMSIIIAQTLKFFFYKIPLEPMLSKEHTQKLREELPIIESQLIGTDLVTEDAQEHRLTPR